MNHHRVTQLAFLMQPLIFILLIACVHCSGTSIGVGEEDVDAAEKSDAQVVVDRKVPPTDAPVIEPDAAAEDAGPDGAPGTCPAPVVSLAQGARCGPQGAGKVCGTSGTVYVCHGAYRPAIAGCVLHSTTGDYTRTLCPSDPWTQVEDPTKLCPVSFPLRFYAQPGGAGTPPEPPIVGGCISGMSSWALDGATGPTFCCSQP